MSGQSAGKPVPHIPGGGVPWPPYSADYVPYLESFGARIFRRLGEFDEGNAQCAGYIV